jgi:predicted Zn-dependent protease
VLLACFALVRPPDFGAFAGAVGIARWSARALAVGYPAWVGGTVLRTARATARLATTSALVTRPLSRPAEVDGAVRVLATAKPVAYAVGGTVVISNGLLGLLDPPERDAVLAHEFAHLRLGHHRLLLLARVAAGTLGRIVPAVRSSHASLARELEVIADQAATGVVGGRRMLARALAKAVLADDGVTRVPSGAALISGGEQDLAYRLDRLTGAEPAQDRQMLAFWAIVLLAVALLVLLAVTVRPAELAIVLAATAIGWLCRRAVRSAR